MGIAWVLQKMDRYIAVIITIGQLILIAATRSVNASELRGLLSTLSADSCGPVNINYILDKTASLNFAWQPELIPGVMDVAGSFERGSIVTMGTQPVLRAPYGSSQPQVLDVLAQLQKEKPRDGVEVLSAALTMVDDIQPVQQTMVSVIFSDWGLGYTQMVFEVEQAKAATIKKAQDLQKKGMIFYCVQAGDYYAAVTKLFCNPARIFNIKDTASLVAAIKKDTKNTCNAPVATLAPITDSPTTSAPTTSAPTTSSPTTRTPTTKTPTTSEPTTARPTPEPTRRPRTAKPSPQPSSAPVTSAPTKSPNTATPSVQPSRAPSTSAPTNVTLTFSPTGGNTTVIVVPPVSTEIIGASLAATSALLALCCCRKEGTCTYCKSKQQQEPAVPDEGDIERGTSVVAASATTQEVFKHDKKNAVREEFNPDKHNGAGESINQPYAGMGFFGLSYNAPKGQRREFSDLNGEFVQGEQDDTTPTPTPVELSPAASTTETSAPTKFFFGPTSFVVAGIKRAEEKGIISKDTLKTTTWACEQLEIDVTRPVNTVTWSASAVASKAQEIAKKVTSNKKEQHVTSQLSVQENPVEEERKVAKTLIAQQAAEMAAHRLNRTHL